MTSLDTCIFAFSNFVERYSVVKSCFKLSSSLNDICALTHYHTILTFNDPEKECF